MYTTRITALLLLATVSAICAQNTNICGQAGQDPPCVNKAAVGDTHVTGQLTPPDSGSTLAISIKVDGKVIESLSVTSKDVNTFDFTVAALKSANLVEVTVGSSTITVPVSPAASGTSSLYTLALVGVNATGASSSGPSQQYFVSFDLRAPIARGRKLKEKETPYPLQNRWWAWADPRIASLPTANTSALNSISSASGLSTGAGSQTIGSITQSFDFQGGIEFALKNAWEGVQFGDRGLWARSSFSLIAGGGALTPFNTSAPTSEYSLNNNLGDEFNQNPSLIAEYPVLAKALCSYGFTGGDGVSCPTTAPTTKPTSVAFVLPNRSRFYRDYYAGLRLRSYYLTGNCPDPSMKLPAPDCQLQNVYPGTFDLRFGQDESVTQHLRGMVLTLAGTYPLPGTQGTVRVFGSAYLGLRRNRISNPLILVPASTVATLDQSSVIVQEIQPTDQDYFRLGLGVDLVPLVTKWVNATKK